MGFLSRLSSIEYQLLKTLTPAPGDDVIVGIVQSVLRAIVGAASLATEPVSSSTLPISFLGATVSWGTNNSTFTVTKSTWQAVDQPINGALVEPTEVGGATTITDMSISLVAPIAGNTPTPTINQDQYTGEISWSGELDGFGQFVFGTVYTATITLTPKAEYTLTGVGANTFQVNSAETVTNPIDSGVITAIFPAAGDGGDIV